MQPHESKLQLIQPPPLTWKFRFLRFILRNTIRKIAKTPEKILRGRKAWELWARYLPKASGITWSPIQDAPVHGALIAPQEGEDLPTVLYFHGGGYCVGSLMAYHSFLTYFCHITQTKVFALDYSLAPESPFPAALNEGVRAYQWLREEHPSKSLFIAGDSAGAGLTFATLLRLKEINEPLPKAALCFSPWADLTHRGPSFLYNEHKDYIFWRESLPIAAKMYGQENDLTHPLISPVYGDLSQLPPILIQVGLEEILLSDSLTLYKKIKETQGSVHLEIWQDMFHAWVYLAPLLLEGRLGLERVRDFIQLQK